MPQRMMDHGGIDPAEALIEKIGYIDDVEVFYNKVLVALYLRPAKMKAIKRFDGVEVNLELPDESRAEDKFQGKAGVVLKLGPTAFVDEGNAQFHGQKVEPGDWIVFRPSHGLKMEINGTLCVLLSDTHIELKIPTPDLVF